MKRVRVVGVARGRLADVEEQSCRASLVEDTTAGQRDNFILGNKRPLRVLNDGGAIRAEGDVRDPLCVAAAGGKAERAVSEGTGQGVSRVPARRLVAPILKLGTRDKDPFRQGTPGGQVAVLRPAGLVSDVSLGEERVGGKLSNLQPISHLLIPRVRTEGHARNPGGHENNMDDGAPIDSPGSGQGEIVHQLTAGGHHRVALPDALEGRKGESGQHPDNRQHDQQLEQRECARLQAVAHSRCYALVARLAFRRAHPNRTYNGGTESHDYGCQPSTLSLFSCSLAFSWLLARPSGPKDQTITGAFS